MSQLQRRLSLIPDPTKHVERNNHTISSKPSASSSSTTSSQPTHPVPHTPITLTLYYVYNLLLGHDPDLIPVPVEIERNERNESIDITDRIDGVESLSSHPHSDALNNSYNVDDIDENIDPPAIPRETSANEINDNKMCIDDIDGIDDRTDIDSIDDVDDAPLPKPHPVAQKRQKTINTATTTKNAPDSPKDISISNAPTSSRNRPKSLPLDQIAPYASFLPLGVNVTQQQLPRQKNEQQSNTQTTPTNKPTTTTTTTTTRTTTPSTQQQLHSTSIKLHPNSQQQLPHHLTLNRFIKSLRLAHESATLRHLGLFFGRCGINLDINNNPREVKEFFQALCPFEIAPVVFNSDHSEFSTSDTRDAINAKNITNNNKHATNVTHTDNHTIPHNNSTYVPSPPPPSQLFYWTPSSFTSYFSTLYTCCHESIPILPRYFTMFEPFGLEKRPGNGMASLHGNNGNNGNNNKGEMGNGSFDHQQDHTSINQLHENEIRPDSCNIPFTNQILLGGCGVPIVPTSMCELVEPEFDPIPLIQLNNDTPRHFQEQVSPQLINDDEDQMETFINYSNHSHLKNMSNLNLHSRNIINNLNSYSSSNLDNPHHNTDNFNHNVNNINTSTVDDFSVRTTLSHPLPNPTLYPVHYIARYLQSQFSRSLSDVYIGYNDVSISETKQITAIKPPQGQKSAKDNTILSRNVTQTSGVIETPQTTLCEDGMGNVRKVNNSLKACVMGYHHSQSQLINVNFEPCCGRNESEKNSIPVCFGNSTNNDNSIITSCDAFDDTNNHGSGIIINNKNNDKNHDPYSPLFIYTSLLRCNCISTNNTTINDSQAYQSLQNQIRCSNEGLGPRRGSNIETLYQKSHNGTLHHGNNNITASEPRNNHKINLNRKSNLECCRLSITTLSVTTTTPCLLHQMTTPIWCHRCHQGLSDGLLGLPLDDGVFRKVCRNDGGNNNGINSNTNNLPNKADNIPQPKHTAPAHRSRRYSTSMVDLNQQNTNGEASANKSKRLPILTSNRLYHFGAVLELTSTSPNSTRFSPQSRPVPQFIGFNDNITQPHRQSPRSNIQYPQSLSQVHQRRHICIKNHLDPFSTSTVYNHWIGNRPLIRTINQMSRLQAILGSIVSGNNSFNINNHNGSTTDSYDRETVISSAFFPFLLSQTQRQLALELLSKNFDVRFVSNHNNSNNHNTNDNGNLGLTNNTDNKNNHIVLHNNTTKHVTDATAANLDECAKTGTTIAAHAMNNGPTTGMDPIPLFLSTASLSTVRSSRHHCGLNGPQVGSNAHLSNNGNDDNIDDNIDNNNHQGAEQGHPAVYPLTFPLSPRVDEDHSQMYALEQYHRNSLKLSNSNIIKSPQLSKILTTAVHNDTVPSDDVFALNQQFSLDDDNSDILDQLTSPNPGLISNNNEEKESNQGLKYPSSSALIPSPPIKAHKHSVSALTITNTRILHQEIDDMQSPVTFAHGDAEAVLGDKTTSGKEIDANDNTNSKSGYLHNKSTLARSYDKELWLTAKYINETKTSVQRFNLHVLHDWINLKNTNLYSSSITMNNYTNYCSRSHTNSCLSSCVDSNRQYRPLELSQQHQSRHINAISPTSLKAIFNLTSFHSTYDITDIYIKSLILSHNQTLQSLKSPLSLLSQDQMLRSQSLQPQMTLTDHHTNPPNATFATNTTITVVPTHYLWCPIADYSPPSLSQLLFICLSFDHVLLLNQQYQYHHYSSLDDITSSHHLSFGSLGSEDLSGGINQWGLLSHCIAGQGRTGCINAAYLIFKYYQYYFASLINPDENNGEDNNRSNTNHWGLKPHYKRLLHAVLLNDAEIFGGRFVDDETTVEGSYLDVDLSLVLKLKMDLLKAFIAGPLLPPRWKQYQFPQESSLAVSCDYNDQSFKTTSGNLLHNDNDNGHNDCTHPFTRPHYHSNGQHPHQHPLPIHQSITQAVITYCRQTRPASLETKQQEEVLMVWELALCRFYFQFIEPR